MTSSPSPPLFLKPSHQQQPSSLLSSIPSPPSFLFVSTLLIPSHSSPLTSLHFLSWLYTPSQTFIKCCRQAIIGFHSGLSMHVFKAFHEMFFFSLSTLSFVCFFPPFLCSFPELPIWLQLFVLSSSLSLVLVNLNLSFLM